MPVAPATPPTPATLSLANAGNIGLRPEGAKVLLRFSEADGTLVSDRAAGLADLKADVGTAEPVSAASWSGKGRRFTAASSQAVKAGDMAGAKTLATRDASIQAIVSLTKTGAGPWHIYTRGTNNGTPAEACSLGLHLSDSGGGLVGVSLFWGDPTGVSTFVAGPVNYRHPSDSEFVLITATRRWVSTTSVLCRFYVDETFIGEVTQTNGDIPGGVSGTTMVGGRKISAAWSGFFNGIIDELAVYDVELTYDQVTNTWRRLAAYQAAGEKMIAGLYPPGARFADDPTNNMGKLSRVFGQALGTSYASAEALRATFLPDADDVNGLVRWENLCRIRAAESDNYELRRTRTIAHLARSAGYNHAAVRDALVELLDVSTGTDLEILEYPNTYSEAWASIDARRWRVDEGTWSVSGGNLLGSALGSDDLRYETALLRYAVRTPLTSNSLSVRLEGSIVASSLPKGYLAGLWLWNGVSNEAFWFGMVAQGSGVMDIGWMKFRNGVATAASILQAGVTAPVLLRVGPRKDRGWTGFEAVPLEWSTNGGVSWSIFDGLDMMHAPEWAGYALTRDFGVAPGVGNPSATFGPIVVHENQGIHPFYWYVYRNPALGGSPDLLGANALLQRLRPAHTKAFICESKTIVAGNAQFGQVGVGPL